VLRSPTGADHPLGHRRRVRVVVERYGQAEIPLAALTQRDAREWDVNREDGAAAPLVDRRGNADADGCDIVIAKRVDDLREAFEECLGGFDRGLAPLRAEDRAVALDDPREDLRAADVDADGALGAHSRRLP
jgi:hypothetical protein